MADYKLNFAAVLTYTKPQSGDRDPSALMLIDMNGLFTLPVTVLRRDETCRAAMARVARNDLGIVVDENAGDNVVSYLGTQTSPREPGKATHVYGLELTEAQMGGLALAVIRSPGYRTNFIGATTVPLQEDKFETFLQHRYANSMAVTMAAGLKQAGIFTLGEKSRNAIATLLRRAPEGIEDGETSATLCPLEQEQLEAIERVFHWYDADGNGAIDLAELEQAASRAGIETTAEELRTYLNRYDTNHDGTIDYPEFVAMMSEIIVDGDDGAEAFASIRSDMRSRLAAARDDRDGAVGREEAEVLLTILLHFVLGKAPERGEAEVAFHAGGKLDRCFAVLCDADPDGAVTRKELAAALPHVAAEDRDRFFACLGIDTDGKVAVEEAAATLAGELEAIRQAALTCVNVGEKLAAENDGGGAGPAVALPPSLLEWLFGRDFFLASFFGGEAKADENGVERGAAKTKGGAAPLMPTGSDPDDLRAGFAAADEDGDGALSPAEARSLVESLAGSTDDDIVAKAMTKCGVAGSSEIGFSRFCSMYTAVLRAKHGLQTPWSTLSRVLSSEA